MKQFSKELGKVSITPKGDWNSSITNEKLDIVYDRRNNQAYIAKQDVPIGVDIDNREYWQPLNVSGYADNNFINLTAENENGTITAYESLEEAVATIFPINRRVGATLSFYNLNSDRLDRQAEFELWQFNSTDLANWENKDYWNNIYYNWNVFAGWYIDADALKNHVETPNIGQYAYVGSNLNDAILYQCRTNGTWTNTGIKVRNYISVVVKGNITIGENGNWFSDGEDTGIPATPAVDEQLDNIITKHESLSRTVQGIAATGGASTATNVTYNNDSSRLNAENAQDAIDELQSSKIDKTSILQESGEAEDKVMSQKAVTDKFSDLALGIEGINGSIIPVSKPELVFGLESVLPNAYVTNVTVNSFVYDVTKESNDWLDINIGSLNSLSALKDFNKCTLFVTFDLEQLAGEDVRDHLNIWRAGQSGYVKDKNAVVKSVQAGFAYYEGKLPSLLYPEGLHIWIEAAGHTKWRISNFKITVAPSYDIIKGGSVDTALAGVDTALAGVDTALAGVIDTKQSRISLFDMEKCASNTRISQILDFLLDLELHWDDGQDDEVYALVSILGEGESKSVQFFAVDENGKYLNTFHAFILNFGKGTGVKYLLDQKIISNSGKTGTCSIVVDWDKWTFNRNAMFPCYHSNSIYSEHAGPIMYLRQLAGLGVHNLENGKKVTYLTTANNTGIVSNVTSNSFEISTNNSGNSWSFTAPPFTPSGKNYIHVKCKLDDLTPDLEGSFKSVQMWISDGRSTFDANGCVNVGRFSTEIDYKFDPAYYTVYKNWTKFGVWLAISAGSSGGTKRWRVTDFEVYEILEVVNGLSGNNAKELFEDVASKLSDINSEIEGLGEVDTELISPSGNKFELSVQDDGTLKALPIIPSKGAFFGNSLLAGSGYGMAASDDRHDYYYLINSYIKGLNNSYVYNKYTSTGFEGITSEDAIESAVNSVVNNLTGDETLVSIQLGDNVNTTEKNAVFPASSLALCKAIRAKCPNARVVWMGMWYSSDSKYQAIQNACKQTGCKFISYEGLKGSDANSKIGNIQKKSSAQRTISDVTNVVENSSSGSIKNITVTFTVSGSSYTSTLDVSSYSLSGGTLTYTSEYEIITAGGVASHPGDEGFRRISNRFLYEMKLTDDQEFYKKS